jgi:peptidoglycan/xylan/chitin deacetylase (PgdA/CDA1 family)
MEDSNRRAVTFYKTLIVATLAALVLFPWGLSITALSKVARLQTQLETVLSKPEPPTNAVAGLPEQSPLDNLEHPPLIQPDPGSPTKVAYLTFDDGPSQNTEAVLEILQQYGIKATFFVIGRSDSHSRQIYRKILQDGHSLGIHSYSHDYGRIYSSVDACMADIGRLNELLFTSTGQIPTLYRFPGGSSNSIASLSLLSQVAYRLAEQDIQYFDWNVDSGDASAYDLPGEQIIRNVVSGVKDKQHAIILLHDSAAKAGTVKALPQIIESLLEQGFIFDRLTKETEPVQHRAFALT